MAYIIKDDRIKAGIDKRVMGILEPKIGHIAYHITRSLLTGYIKTLLVWAKDHEFEME